MFANTKKLLVAAQRGHYAIGHFNINNMETLQGVVMGAANASAPIIVAVSEGALTYAGWDYIISLIKTASRSHRGSIPLALHLDHGSDMKIVARAIREGFSSVMIDASHFDFEHNIAITKKVVQLAHRHGISVEAELGTIGVTKGDVKSRNIQLTDPHHAAEFVARTGCDFLAVAIGTSHGAYKFNGSSGINIKLLKSIRKMVSIPLVLHGASGIPTPLVAQARKYGAHLDKASGVSDHQIKAAIASGICKINIDTDIRISLEVAVRKALFEHPEDIDPRHMLGPARENIAQLVVDKIQLFGSQGIIKHTT